MLFDSFFFYFQNYEPSGTLSFLLYTSYQALIANEVHIGDVLNTIFKDKTSIEKVRAYENPCFFFG